MTLDAYTTWTDNTVFRSRDGSFRALRSMRHSPPGSARGAARAAVFAAGLEQAQQQIDAAASVGYETRPLNLFYGLSQAGRSIAAAATGLPDTHPPAFPPGKNDVLPWELEHHGIEVPNLNRVIVRSFPTMRLAKKGKSHSPASFVRLSSLLSPGCEFGTAGAGVSMAQLWSSVLEVNTRPLDARASPVMTLVVDEPQDGPTYDAVRARAHLLTFAPVPALSGTLSDRKVNRFLARYPTLTGTRLLDCYDPGEYPGHVIWSTQPGPSVLDGLCIPIPDERLWVLPPHQHRWITRPLTTMYRWRPVVLPGYSDVDTEPLHPLLTWWAILFGLSMLCRYRPVVWTQLIDINRSKYASAIEHLLDVGLDAVPDLIERTIREVS